MKQGSLRSVCAVNWSWQSCGRRAMRVSRYELTCFVSVGVKD